MTTSLLFHYSIPHRGTTGSSHTLAHSQQWATLTTNKTGYPNTAHFSNDAEKHRNSLYSVNVRRIVVSIPFPVHHSCVHIGRRVNVGRIQHAGDTYQNCPEKVTHWGFGISKNRTQGLRLVIKFGRDFLLRSNLRCSIMFNKYISRIIYIYPGSYR